MKQFKFLFCSLLMLSFCMARLQAQDAIATSGGIASGTDGSASYTVGQMLYTTNTGTSGSVAQGVQQPYEISIISGIKEAIGITMECSVYPNPTKDFLTLKVENYKLETLSYQLYDVTGKLIENKIIEGNLTNIAMSSLNASLYFLKVLQGRTEVKTFKIVKN